MTEIYLIRHTTPDIEKGWCYGQSDIGLAPSYSEEMEAIRSHIPPEISQVFSSPLNRCKMLAGHLFPGKDLHLEKDLMEIHCGAWEHRRWEDIPEGELDPWMKDFVHVRIPGGESYVDLYERVIRRFRHIATLPQISAICTHGGVIRSILCHITRTPLEDSFGAFGIRYGCVIRIKGVGQVLEHEFLHNPGSEPETHRPKRN